MEDKMIDQTQLAEDLSSKIKYEFRQMFLVKPLEPVKVKKKISEPVAKDTKPKKDKDGIEAVDYDEVKTEIKEVDSDFSRAVVLKLPYEYTHPYDDEKIQQMPIKVGDIVIYRHLEALCILICSRTLNSYRFTILQQLKQQKSNEYR